MIADPQPNRSGNIEQIFGSAESTPVSDELRKLAAMLAPLCPKDCSIKFEFDGKLHIHIDVRHLEELTTIEALLPEMCGGIFRNVQRGIADRHSFFHRLTTVVLR